MKRSILLIGVLSLGGCGAVNAIPSAPAALGDDMYTMRIGVRSGVQAIEDGGAFCASQNKKFKYIRDTYDNHLVFACLNDGERIEMRAPTQKLQLEMR